MHIGMYGIVGLQARCAVMKVHFLCWHIPYRCNLAVKGSLWWLFCGDNWKMTEAHCKRRASCMDGTHWNYTPQVAREIHTNRSYPAPPSVRSVRCVQCAPQKVLLNRQDLTCISWHFVTLIMKKLIIDIHVGHSRGWSRKEMSGKNRASKTGTWYMFEWLKLEIAMTNIWDMKLMKSCFQFSVQTLMVMKF